MTNQTFYNKLSQNVSDEAVEFVRDLEDKLNRKAGSMSLRWTSAVRDEAIHFSLESPDLSGTELGSSRQAQIKGEDGFEVNTEGDVQFIGSPFQGIVPMIYGDISDLDIHEMQENWSDIRKALKKTCHKIESVQN
jgi:hypothetical protein